MSKKNKTMKTAPTKSAGPGKGRFKATPLTFTGTDGAEHTYGGRGRYCLALAQIVVRDLKVPRNSADGWVWRDADSEELASANALVESVTAKATAKAASVAARLEARAKRLAAKELAKAAPKVKTPAKPRSRKAKVEVPVEVPVETDEVTPEVPVTVAPETMSVKE